MPPFITNQYYHIYNRGNNKEPIFFRESNYIFFLNKFKYYLSGNLTLLCFCLLPNHFHLLVKVKDRGSDDISVKISNLLRRFFISYSQAINKQEERVGSLFQKPFKRKIIRNEEQLLLTVYYIHFNSVKHGIDESYTDYKWSSYPSIVNQVGQFLNIENCIRMFGGIETFIDMHRDAFINKKEIRMDAIARSDGILNKK